MPGTVEIPEAAAATARKRGTMKAFVMHEIGKVGVVDKPIPNVGPNDALVRTTAALICTSDVHTVKGAIGPRENRTLGHEAVGVVEKLGGAVSGLEVGQRVTVAAITPCWKCENCLRGFPSQCGEALGGWKFANTKDGNLAEYFHVNDAQANVTPIPDDVGDELAVYVCDMLSTGFMGAEQAAIPIGGTVAVLVPVRSDSWRSRDRSCSAPDSSSRSRTRGSARISRVTTARTPSWTSRASTPPSKSGN
jgi:threonine dehydrogenase-like Zn-dependent dehydrogenase